MHFYSTNTFLKASNRSNFYRDFSVDILSIILFFFQIRVLSLLATSYLFDFILSITSSTKNNNSSVSHLVTSHSVHETVFFLRSTFRILSNFLNPIHEQYNHFLCLTVVYTTRKWVYSVNFRLFIEKPRQDKIYTLSSKRVLVFSPNLSYQKTSYMFLSVAE